MNCNNDCFSINFLSMSEEPRDYVYDDNGNITQLGGSSFSISGSSNKITNSGYGYDNNGNMTTHQGNTVIYNWRNEIVQYQVSGDYPRYFNYDAFGQRVKNEQYTSIRYYITSGQNVLEEYATNTGSNPTLNILHIYAGSQRIASIVPGNDIYYVCSDQIMSSKVMVDETGNNDQTRDYYPYGATRTASGSISAYQFSGKEKDVTGLYYFGARYYDPTIGRWLSCDPAEQGWSPYVYCGNNPIIMVDPDGEFFGDIKI